MPRPHQREKKQKKSTGKAKAATVSAMDLIHAAQAATENMQVEQAVQLYRRALSLEPTNYNIMDALADLCLQLGEADDALQLLTVSTTNAPETNPIKWMYLAQMIRGEDAVRAYRTGIDLLSRQLQSNDSVSSELQKEIISAYCGIAELYMTDLCFEPNAEESCETAIMNALVLDSANGEALQTLASLRISQCRKNEAADIVANLNRRYEEIIRYYKQRTIQDELKCTEQDMEKLNNLPTPEHCIALVKLLLECIHENDQTRQHFPINAEFLLQYVLQFDDENPEVWYLLGMSNKERVPADVEAAVEAFSQCKALLSPFLTQQKQLQPTSDGGHAEDCSAPASSIEILFAAVGSAEQELLQAHGSERVEAALAALQSIPSSHDIDDDNEEDAMQMDDAVAAVSAAIQQHQQQNGQQSSVFQFSSSAFKSQTQNNSNNNKTFNGKNKAVARAAAQEEEEDTWSTDDEAMDDAN